MAPPRISKPQFEHLNTSTSTNNPRPRISWQYLVAADTTANWAQTGYELKITTSGSSQATATRIESSEQTLVPWPAEALKSRSTAVVQVRAFGSPAGGPKGKEETEWSEPSTVQVCLLEREDWRADFVACPSQQDSDGTIRPIRFWKTFSISNSVSKARLYITALGVFEVYINGELVGDECLAPGWTSYKHRLTYRILDVGNLLRSDATNTICIYVAEGWYAGRLGFKGGKRFWYGEKLATLAQLEIEIPDGLFTVSTDETWTCSTGAIISSGIYDGEIFDDCEENDFTQISTTSNRVEVLAWPSIRLDVAESPPVRVIEHLKVQKTFKSPSGCTILDFGQNLVGKLHLESCDLEEGARLTFRHAEVLEHGELGTRPLRLAKATDTIIGSGREIKDWTPTFTFHGFRYVEVEGWPGDIGSIESQLTACVLHSDMKHRGTFKCSNEHVNRLHENVLWSTKGNFLSIPTDCPQRDERLGWTGDIQVFTPTASFLFDTSSFLGSWLQDVADEQLEDGRNGVPPLVVPDVIPSNWPQMPQAVWDDVTVLTPFDVYQADGDTALLERQFSSMQAWLDQGIDRGLDRLWNFDRWQLSDWLDPSAPPEDPGNGRTDGVLVADAYLIRVTVVMAKVCQLLGKAELSTVYTKDAHDLKQMFAQKYMSPAGNLMSNTQTGISLALRYNLYDSAEKCELAAAQLAKLVRTARFHISTGFAGTPEILHALTQIGKPELAYRMLLEKTCPCWLYPVTMGATTIWERWNSMLPDGTINPGQMTSFNHYALGAVANWLHSTVAGISPLEPGWKVIKVRPIPGGNLTSAEASFDGPYGMVECSWVWQPDEGGKFTLRLVVPPNSSARVILPSVWRSGGEEVLVGSGVHEFVDEYEQFGWPPEPLIAPNQSMPDAQIAE